MSAQITIAANERGRVRVFALSLPTEEVRKRTQTRDGMFALLGPSGALDDAHIALFEVADIQEIGLSGYLVEGGDVTDADIAPDRAKLDKLGGWVMVVYSSAFGDAEMTLTPVPEMTLIGTYGQHPTDWRATETIQSKSAEPYSAPPETAKKKKPSDAAMSGRVATMVLIVLALFTVIFIWIAG